MSSASTSGMVGSRVLEDDVPEPPPARHLPELPPRDPEAQRLDDQRDTEDAVAPDQRPRRDLGGVEELVYSLEDREGATDAEEHEGDDERPEVALARAAEGEALVGGARRQAHAHEEERLVAGVREGMNRLGEGRRGPGEIRRRELADRDRDVAGERGDDDLLGVGDAHGPGARSRLSALPLRAERRPRARAHARPEGRWSPPRGGAPRRTSGRAPGGQRRTAGS